MRKRSGQNHDDSSGWGARCGCCCAVKFEEEARRTYILHSVSSRCREVPRVSHVSALPRDDSRSSASVRGVCGARVSQLYPASSRTPRAATRYRDYFGQSASGASILLPIGALRALRHLTAFSNGKCIVISGDKGNNNPEQFRGLMDPHIAVHGSFSVMVNYHAIGMCVRARACLSSPPPGAVVWFGRGGLRKSDDDDDCGDEDDRVLQNIQIQRTEDGHIAVAKRITRLSTPQSSHSALPRQNAAPPPAAPRALLLSRDPPR